MNPALCSNVDHEKKDGVCYSPKAKDEKCAECKGEPPIIPEYCGACKKMKLGDKKIEVVGLLVPTPPSSLEGVISVSK